MTQETTVYEFIWQSIPVQVTYTPYYTDGLFFGGASVLSHLEIQASEPLPITQTGYKSIFFFQTIHDMLRDPEQCVRVCLDEGTESKAWQKYLADELQPSLFI